MWARTQGSVWSEYFSYFLQSQPPPPTHPFLFKWRNRQITGRVEWEESGEQAIIWNDDMYFSFNIVDTFISSLRAINITNAENVKIQH